MKLSELIAPHTLEGPNDPDITGLTANSRAVKPGFLFAALPGFTADGRDYIENALENGAAAILSTPGLPDMPVPYLAKAEPRAYYSQLAAQLYPMHPKIIAAMTGTNGKSSTVEFLRQIWDFAGKSAACFGTLGVITKHGTAPLKHTTPDAVVLHETLHGLAEDGITHCAMEASSHGLKQFRLDAVPLSAVGFSNLTQDHFDYHKNFEDYFTAKARLFSELAPKGTPAVITVDDDHGMRMAELAKTAGLEVMTVGQAGRDIRIDSLTPKSASQLMELIWDGRRIKTEIPLAGDFQALNVVCALGLAVSTGIAPETALEAIKHLKGVAGRMEKVGQTKDGAPVFVDFAHSPDGLEKLLHGVRPHTKGRIIVVFGCGGDRDPDKRAKMGRIAARLAGHVIVTDDNPRTENAGLIREAVMQGCPDAENIGGRAEAIARGIALLEKDDCLVIAGKGHESGQIVGETIIPFSDAEEAKKALEEAR